MNVAPSETEILSREALAFVERLHRELAKTPELAEILGLGGA